MTRLKQQQAEGAADDAYGTIKANILCAEVTCD